ncbi:carbamoyltransferase HypF [Geobacter luticola]|uniref:Carbamoyltransferase n=2 Tax=Geomobilimonas luticola TaxID=1114878 RepID=A0ABS5S890_9BACT|nr:carbamoyltransferase HypF [Geomobilimonas luticola]MBT0651588.1 carbamoyltransferase HypF [Geomobilimonas luticola]
MPPLYGSSRAGRLAGFAQFRLQRLTLGHIRFTGRALLTDKAYTIKRIRLEIEGIVQGVGFRPFIYRLAARHRLRGWVRNTGRGVLVESEGEPADLERFLAEITPEAPPLAVISALSCTELAPMGGAGFAILASDGGESRAMISPDCDVCPDCLAELFDPADRRYRYPFITCTNCGPRYSIITGTPYDRPFTTMAPFAMCPACRAEYDDPASRRFHAQPNACPVCGPRLRLTGAAEGEIAGDPLDEAVRLLREGGILAVKGVGGYHLAVDAGNEEGVRELRRRKQRDEKPFALMASNLAAIAGFAQVDDTEARLLSGTERPIVLLRKREGHAIAPSVAPANGYFGVMLPATPLHHLLLRDTFDALVMTSGNVTDEPIAFRDEEARNRLAGIADAFLCHDREIHTRVDDSVLRLFRGNPLFLRRSRGYVPRGILLPVAQKNVLAVGAELKAAVCLTRGDQAFLSQHIGDLQNAATLASLDESVAHLQRLLDVQPEMVAHDLHPDYMSTAYAGSITGLPVLAVQHHHAHLAACMAENGLEGETIGVIFDGTGYGTDGAIWGGEFLLGDYREFKRAGHFRYVPLPGGDTAVREPFRMAAAWLHRTYGAKLFSLPLPCLAEVGETERGILLRMLERGINSPPTSSCGRLFDAAAAILGVRSRISYEGQAAIELEALAEEGAPGAPFPFAITTEDGRLVLDFAPLFAAMTEELLAGVPVADLARRFHATIALAAVEVCERVRDASGVSRVALSGGVFQNKLLSEEMVELLAARGFDVCTHRLVPPNDGGLALGQAVIAGWSDV